MITVMGKSEGKDTNWHGHVSAVTGAPNIELILRPSSRAMSRCASGPQLSQTRLCTTSNAAPGGHIRIVSQACIPSHHALRSSDLRFNLESSIQLLALAMTRIWPIMIHGLTLLTCGCLTFVWPTCSQRKLLLRGFIRAYLQYRRHKHVQKIRVQPVSPSHRILFRNRRCIWLVRSLQPIQTICYRPQI